MFKRETVIALSLIAISGVAFAGTLTLPASKFEPLGSAAFPRAITALIILLSLAMLIRSWMSNGQAAGELGPGPSPAHENEDGQAPEPHPGLAAGLLALGVALVALMDAGQIDFSFLGTIFLFVAMGWLTRFTFRAMPLTLVLAVLGGYGTDYVFSNILIINLP